MAIHIKPSHEGRFTARARSQGHSIGGQIKKDIGKGGNEAKQANFARMARRHWKPLNSKVKGNDEHHGHLDPNEGGGPRHDGAPNISHGDRGGFGHSGHHEASAHGTEHGHVPGGHTATHDSGHGGGGRGADGRIRNRFRGKHPAGRLAHHVGVHASHAHHPHNLPHGQFGGGPVGEEI